MIKKQGNRSIFRDFVYPFIVMSGLCQFHTFPCNIPFRYDSAGGGHAYCSSVPFFIKPGPLLHGNSFGDIPQRGGN